MILPYFDAKLKNHTKFWTKASKISQQTYPIHGNVQLDKLGSLGPRSMDVRDFGDNN